MAAILLMFSTMVCRSAENASYLDRVNFAEWNNTSNAKKTTNTNNTTDTKNTKNTTNKANSTFTSHKIFQVVISKNDTNHDRQRSNINFNMMISILVLDIRSSYSALFVANTHH